MIEARCLSCGHQQAVAEFVAEGGKVHLNRPLLIKLYVGGLGAVVLRHREGICWRCDRERRAQAMTGAQ